jgi:hypothetical protein
MLWASTEASPGPIPIPETGAKPSTGLLTALKLKNLLPTAPFASPRGELCLNLGKCRNGPPSLSVPPAWGNPPQQSSKEAVMMKTLMLGTALSALLLSGAFAQAPNAPSSPTSPPPAASTPATPPAAASSDQSSPAAAKSDDNAKPATTGQANDKASDKVGGKADFVSSQKPDQWLASKFKGTDVMGPDNQKIGDVTDILFDKSGKIEAYVVSVGGFLGMGSKDVALAPQSFDVTPGSNGSADKLRLSMTKDQLKEAKNFEPYQPPRPAATTGSGRPGGSPMGGSRPLGGTPAGSGGMGR